MIEPLYIEVLCKLYTALKDSDVNWTLTGSLGQALQGLPLTPHDIDIQTGEVGAYEIERRFATCVIRKVAYSATEKIRSHFGALLIDGVQVELMGDVQKRLVNGAWEDPVDLQRHTCVVDYKGMRIPVLSLEYECQAYLKLGRIERARMLREFIDAHQPGK
ncbi:MAG: hypothetical protein M3Z08_05250 [Chloroflexota bacterium]|nr:hypothetical protein [Chloroflexota bacterium]